MSKMDIENMRKMNSMISELKRHGISNNSEEAVQFAEKLYPNRSIFPANEAAAQNRPEKVEPVEKGLSSEEIMYLIKKVVVEHQDENNKLVESAFQKMYSEIGQLKAKLEDAYKRFDTLGSRIQQQPSRQDIRVTELAPSANVPPPVQEQRPKVVPPNVNQRTGDLRPGDVDIADFFYCGKR